MSLTPQQVTQLLMPINERRVLTDGKGHSHVSQQDVLAHLIRVFGFGNFDITVLSVEPIFEQPRDDRGDRFDVCYRALVRLTVRDPAGNTLCTYENGSTATAQNQKRGDAHDLAYKSAISLSVKRAAIALGDNFGLSLYNKGQLSALVMDTMVKPATDEDDVATPSIETLAERVVEKVQVDPETGCWNFTGAKAKGYGRVGYYAGAGKQVVLQAHRVVWEAQNGPIADGLTIDHLCANRACVNVGHMETVTPGENSRRGADRNPTVLANRAKTECPQGHKYTEENTYSPPSGGRFCRICGRAATKRWREKAIQEGTYSHMPAYAQNDIAGQVEQQVSLGNDEVDPDLEPPKPQARKASELDAERAAQRGVTPEEERAERLAEQRTVRDALGTDSSGRVKREERGRVQRTTGRPAEPDPWAGRAEPQSEQGVIDV